MRAGLAQISSHELSEWRALAIVEADEAQRHRDQVESGDGEVHISGRDPDDDDDDDPEDDLTDGESVREPVGAGGEDPGDA